MGPTRTGRSVAPASLVPADDSGQAVGDGARTGCPGRSPGPGSGSWCRTTWSAPAAARCPSPRASAKERGRSDGRRRSTARSAKRDGQRAQRGGGVEDLVVEREVGRDGGVGGVQAELRSRRATVGVLQRGPRRVQAVLVEGAGPVGLQGLLEFAVRADAGVAEDGGGGEGVGWWSWCSPGVGVGGGSWWFEGISVGCTGEPRRRALAVQLAGVQRPGCRAGRPPR